MLNKIKFGLFGKTILQTLLFFLLLTQVCSSKTASLSTSQSGLFQHNSGTNANFRRVCFLDSQTGWASGYLGTILSITKGGVSFIEEEQIGELPAEFSLLQHYLKPFNLGKVFSYQLPVSGDAILKVYEVLGNEIATFVDEYKFAVRYEVEFSAKGGSASGGNVAQVSGPELTSEVSAKSG